MSMKPNYVNRKIFTTEKEKEMIEYIDDRNRTCYGIDLFEFLEKVYFTAVRNRKEILKKIEGNKKSCWVKVLIQIFFVFFHAIFILKNSMNL